MHRDRADGMPGHPEFSGDRCDGGAVDHQPPQHIPGTPTRRRGPWGGQLAKILIEYRTPALRCAAAIARYGNLQHQRVAGHRQIDQRPYHGVAVTTILAAVWTAWITHHRGTKDRRGLLIDSGVGDRHPQLDGAHDRVGNNRRRAASNLGQGSPRWVWWRRGWE